VSFVERSPSPLSLYYVANTSFDEHYSQQISMNAPLTMAGVPRTVPTLKALSCAAVEVDSSLQAMDWTVMISMNATLTMVGVHRLVPTQKAPLCAAVEVDTSLQAMD